MDNRDVDFRMQDKYETLRNAERMVLGRKLDQAIREYEKLLQSAGDDPGVLNTLGDLLLKDGRRDEALRRFRRVADIFVQGGYSAKAAAVCKKILQVNPVDAETSGLLVELYERQGMVPEAVRHMEDLSARFRTWGKLEEALHVQERILKIDPDSPRHLLEAGRLYSHRGESSQAARLFSQAAVRFLAEGKPDEAEKSLHEAQRLELGGPEIEDALQSLQNAADRDVAGQDQAEVEGAESAAREAGDAPARSDHPTEKAQEGGFELSPEPVQYDSEEGDSGGSGKSAVNGADRVELQRFDDFLRSASGEESESEDSTQEGVSGLWSAEEADEDDLDFAQEKPFEPPKKGAAEQEEVGPFEGSLEDALQEADFYLKLGYGEEARRLLSSLVREFPEDERVLRRAEKAMVPVPQAAASEFSAAPADEAEGVSFDQQIDRALDQLFTDEADDRTDEILRYDVASSGEETSEEDPKAHYELGLAYKEMGLLEDSIEKFTEAFRLFEDDRNIPHKILCCSMLASSFIRLGEYEKARDWAEWGLELPEMKDFEWKALLYDSSYAREQLGELEEALQGYRQILEKDSTYRDIEERIDMLSVQVDAQ